MTKERLFTLWKKEWLHLLREPFLLIIFSTAVTVQLVFFGYCSNTDVRQITFLYHDPDQTEKSLSFIESMLPGNYFQSQGRVEKEEEIVQNIKEGGAQVGIVLPEDFYKKYREGKTLPFKIYLDGTEPQTALIAKTYFLRLLKNFFEKDIKSPIPAASFSSIKIPEIKARYTLLNNPELQSPWYIVPGVLASMVQIMVTVLSAVVFARERESGTLASVQMSPIRPLEFLLGKTVPLFILSLVHILIGFIVGCLWFHIPFTGSFTLLFLSSILFTAFSLGVGFLAASVSQTQYQAIMTCFFVVMPSLFLSGILHPVSNMPVFLQGLAWLTPLYYYTSIARGALITGLGWGQGWVWFLPLLAVTLLIALFSALKVRSFFTASPQS